MKIPAPRSQIIEPGTVAMLTQCVRSLLNFGAHVSVSSTRLRSPETISLLIDNKGEKREPARLSPGSAWRRGTLLHVANELATRLPWPATRARPGRELPSADGLNEALDVVPTALIAIDRQDRILYANPEAAALFGFRREELVTESITLIFPTLCGNSAYAILEAASSPTCSWWALAAPTFIAKRQDGDELLVSVTTRVYLHAGTPALLAAIVKFSGRRERHHVHREIIHLARVSAVGALAGSLAHELNQPLTAILSNAQAAHRFLDANPIDLLEVRETLNDIIEDNCRAGEIIRKTAALVGKSDTEMQSLDVGGIVRDALMLVHSDAVVRAVKIMLGVANDLPVVRGDRVQLQQVVLNLLLNGFDAVCDCAPADRIVSVQVSARPDSSVCIAVTDRGPGVAQNQIHEIFTPFFTTKPQGLGLGLPISRSIVEAHGGRLWAENNSGRGATFYITLPFDIAQ
ncbi:MULTISPECIES: sensor histidine kinase [Paraburkholderia]|uniref:sensor histidine kinase n=1 Tax=Paraburkholderia TaxID=1822464 RepID=UPI00078B8E60|nr:MULTISPECIES: ATP-binding protein [Paraburkholderia]AMV47732.1 hypothetical protein ATN79_44505 [Paraburkholderia caribensis]